MTVLAGVLPALVGCGSGSDVIAVKGPLISGSLGVHIRCGQGDTWEPVTIVTNETAGRVITDIELLEPGRRMEIGQIQSFVGPAEAADGARRSAIGAFVPPRDDPRRRVLHVLVPFKAPPCPGAPLEVTASGVVAKGVRIETDDGNGVEFARELRACIGRRPAQNC